MSRKQVVMQKIAGLCRIICPLAALSFIALAISYSLSWFRWTENALSDLAGTQATATAAAIFNSGLIIGAILGIIFTAGLMQVLRKHILGFVGTFILLLADISLFAIGVFPETAGRVHTYVSVAFFMLFPISLFFIGASMVKETSERILGFATVLFGMFAVVSAAPIVPVRVNDVGIHELLAALSGSAWSIVFGFELCRQSILH